jgi:CheY-like chemotaxis protein
MPLHGTLRFRRRLLTAGLAVAVILLLVFYLAFHSSVEAAGLNRWAAHSQEVPSAISRARLEPASLQNRHDVLRAVKADDRTRPIPVVVLNWSDRDRGLIQCCRLGVNSYIQKPTELLKFQESVRHFATYWLMVTHMPPPSTFTAQGLGESL